MYPVLFKELTNCFFASTSSNFLPFALDFMKASVSLKVELVTSFEVDVLLVGLSICLRELKRQNQDFYVSWRINY